MLETRPAHPRAAAARHVGRVDCTCQHQPTEPPARAGDPGGWVRAGRPDQHGETAFRSMSAHLLGEEGLPEPAPGRSGSGPQGPAAPPASRRAAAWPNARHPAEHCLPCACPGPRAASHGVCRRRATRAPARFRRIGVLGVLAARHGLPPASASGAAAAAADEEGD